MRYYKIIGIILIAATLVLNEWFLKRFFSTTGDISPAYRIFIWFFDLVLVIMGTLFLFSRSKNLGFRLILCVIVGGSIVGTALLASEIILNLQSKKDKVATNHTQINAYEKYYDQTKVQSLHPFYYFFFSRNEEEIKKMNNAVFSIDKRGFRGAVPEERGGRKLGFIIGGSAAFGIGSSSNDTTIAGYLNKIQSEYHFVNAGVPGWVSVQEFYRLALELLDYKPDIVIAFDGFNDGTKNYYHNYKQSYPAGMTWFYVQLEKLIAERSSGFNIGDFIGRSFRKLAFPRTANFVNRLISKDDTTSDSGENNLMPSDALLRSAKSGAKRYTTNLELMDTLATRYGSRFLAIFQPTFLQHKNTPEKERELLENYHSDYPLYMNEFSKAVKAEDEESPYFHDFSDIFDKHFQNVLLGDTFIDRVHLSDRGNEIVAKEIVKILK